MKTIQHFKEDPFKAALFTICIIFFALFSFFHFEKEKDSWLTPANPKAKFEIFYNTTCPHCHVAKKFINKELIPNYKTVNFKKYKLESDFFASLISSIFGKEHKTDNVEKFLEYKEKLNIPNMGVPTVVINGEEYVQGFGSYSTTGIEYKRLLDKALNKKTTEKGIENETNAKDKEIPNKINVPLFGEVDLVNKSLPLLTVILGLVDGFNPCAMWVLIFMISIIAGLKDKRKIWFIVGSFVFASGVLYYLFMTIWFNTFKMIGYVYYIQMAVGFGALYIGLLSLRDYITGKIECEVGDLQARQRTKNKIKETIMKPMTITTLLAVIGLAFTVNAIEFACSIGIPIIYNNVLALENLSAFVSHMYILMYVFFFMLDDLIIFGLAAFAVNKFIGDKYLKYSKLIGGFVLTVLGFLIIFFPEILR